jgi:hypothetical protein
MLDHAKSKQNYTCVNGVIQHVWLMWFYENILIINLEETCCS